MNHQADVVGFLWQLVRQVLVDQSSIDHSEEIIAFLRRNPALPKELTRHLDSYREVPDPKVIAELARMLLQTQKIDLDYVALFVAALAKGSYLNMAEAARFLDHETSKIDHLPKQIRQVFYAAFHVLEDSRDGVMSPEEEPLLMNALLSILEHNAHRDH